MGEHKVNMRHATVAEGRAVKAPVRSWAPASLPPAVIVESVEEATIVQRDGSRWKFWRITSDE